MQYIDSKSRQANDALGAWLEKHVFDDAGVTSLRWQSGFFGGEILGYFAPTMERLSASDGPLRVLFGSNNGVTRSKDVGQLLKLAGPPRAQQQVGVVSFTGGLYHPKTIHITRADGSTAAYVGSANLTKNGLASVNIEAGILLDTREGDSVACLQEVAAAVDWWFSEDRDGLTVLQEQADIDALIAAGVLDRPTPPPPAPTEAKLKSRHGSRLKPLVKIPTSLPPPAAAAGAALAPGAGAPAAEWTKRLSGSDAQRKKSGNQRGSITLVQAGYGIDAQVYFRHDFFGGEPWVKGATFTGAARETASVEFAATILGQDLGNISLNVSYASNREADQNNYTSLLHIEGISDLFRDHDFTGKWLQLARDAEGRYSLTISDVDPRT